MQRGRELVSGRNLSHSFGHRSLKHSQIWSGEDQICHHIALTILKYMDFMVSSFFSLQVQLSCHGLGEAPLVSEHQPPNPLALILQFFLP